MIKRAVLLACLLCAAIAMGQENSSVQIIFDEKKQEDATQSTSPPIEQLFKNPALSAGLASGADAINRSVESLMDALFYSLLDNDLRFDMTDHSYFGIGLQRDVFSAPSGADIVVDRIDMGPRYNREMWRVQDVPVTLGVEGTVEVLQIYLRSHGQRIAEHQELPWWRRTLNNWFGLLPLASSVLPPSFNQNELYDPLRQVATPFIFPLTIDTFYAMPVGSIRSYAISGGATYTLGLGGLLDQATRNAFDTLEGLKENLPYQVFVRGEHRINVLRRGQDTAWVGMSRVKRGGHAISTVLGNTLFLLSGSISQKIWQWDWTWQGIPAPMYPMDARLELAAADVFDQLYEFDLRNPHAQGAYLSAVGGDFGPAQAAWRMYFEQEIETGVVYHFTRIQDRDESQVRNGPNIGVLKKERQTDLFDAEIEITDQDGKFYVLEAEQRLTEKWLDILVGEETEEHTTTAEIAVKKVLVDKDDPRLGDAREIEENLDRELVTGPYGSTKWVSKKAPAKDEIQDEEGPGRPADWRDDDGDGIPDGKRYAYVFSYDDNDPIQLRMNFSIRDRYLDAEEYEEYIELLRFFTMMPLDGVPQIRVRDEDRQRTYRRFSFFDDPSRASLSVHVTPTYLGRFGAQAIVSFDTKELNKILDTSDEDKWIAFAKAFGKDEALWGDADYRESFGFQSQFLTAFFLYPTKLVNLRFASVDAAREATNAIKALNGIRELKTPLEKMRQFYKLFDTHHPLFLTRALLILSDQDRVPRWVSFSSEPRGSASAAVKNQFRRLNGQEYSTEVDLPPPTRYRRAKKKMAAFYLDQPREDDDKPHIQRIEVFTKGIPDSVRQLEAEGESAQPVDRNARHVFVRLEINDMDPEVAGKIYVRAEQAGKVKFGKLELAEQVLELMPLGVEGNPDVLRYEFFATGPLSPLSNFVFDSAVSSGDDFIFTFSASSSGQVWSDERSVEFHFSKGTLRPIDDD